MSTLKTTYLQQSSSNITNLTLNTDGTISGPGGAIVYSGGRNRIINGGMDVWQRSTSFPAIANSAYSADRWWVVGDAVGTVNVSQQDISSQGLGLQYCLRAERTVGSNRWTVGTNLELSELTKMKGKTVTLSFYLRKGSALTSDVTAIVATKSTEAKFGTAIDSTTVVATNSGISTSTFTRYSVSLSIPANTAANGISVEITANQTGANNAYFDISGVQLEVGSVATPYEIKGYGQELTLCQRYLFKINCGTAYGTYGNGWTTSTTNANITITLPITMRATPTELGSYGTTEFQITSNGAATVSAIAIGASESNAQRVVIYATLGATTANIAGQWRSQNNAAGYLYLGADL